MTNNYSEETNQDTPLSIKKDTVVSFHYQLYRTNEAGEKGDLLESSFDGTPVTYLQGHNNIIRGLEKVMADKVAGDEFEIALQPDEAYGQRDDNAIKRIPAKHIYEFKKGKTFQAGQVVTVKTDQGARQVVVLKAGKFNVDVDFNHPLAGASLFYKIAIKEVRAATQEELAHGHAHGPGGHQH